jgi:hypothetical protein
MATIHQGEEGKAPYVLLDESDQDLLLEAVWDRRRKGHSVSKMAKTVGISRPHFYVLLKTQRVELMRIASLQALLNVQILPLSEIEKYLTGLKDLLYIN